MNQDARIGLALGSGAARGIAHICVLETLDELGIRPAAIAGASMGALVGAAYASGLAARDIRRHVETVLGNRLELARRLFNRKDVSALDLINLRWGAPVQIDGVALVEVVLPEGTAEKVEDTEIPLSISTSEFYAARERIIARGSMVEAVAASIAIPGVIEGPQVDGELLIDGGVTNPVPFDHFGDDIDIVIAVDVTGWPRRRRKPPSLADLTIGTVYIMQHRITRLQRQITPPDIYITPDTGNAQAHEFFRVREILATAAAVGETLKQELRRVGVVRS